MAAPLSVKDLMKTNVATLTPGTTLQETRGRMADLGVRHMPVVDHDGHLVGLLSQRDLMRALEPAMTAQGHRTVLAVGDVMTKDMVVAAADTPAVMAVEAMITRKIGAVPIVDNTQHLLGMVTETDFLEIAHEALLGFEPAARARS
jgi:CBS domain-containing protein